MTPPDLPIEELRAALYRDGYLWVHGALSRDEVLAFRERYFTACGDAGLLASGTPVRDGIYAGGGEDKAMMRRLFFEGVRWASFDSLCVSPMLVSFFERLFGGGAPTPPAPIGRRGGQTAQRRVFTR